MGDSITSLRLVLKSLSESRPWMIDSDVINLPWRSDSKLPSSHSRSTLQLSFGVMQTDGVVAPHPPITRALRMVIQAVEAAGYETLTWEPPAHRKGAKIHVRETLGWQKD
ncbi:MAG: hypothetical protein L6R38_006686 [Xanthoria sp. 2 TBL-2021]|nr:MAG: hypothetical protein L6R38_006686 [Xanthoria sp. 2 TBL-2021]